MVALNKSLVERQELSEDDIEELQHLHSTREDLFRLAGNLDLTKETDVATIRVYATLLEALEYDMQRVWKFDQNPHYHSWWYKMPHCKCPTMDNDDLMGSEYRICNTDCKIHTEQ